MIEAIIDYFDEWAKGKIWYFRASILAVMLFFTFQICTREGYHSLFSGINLGIHEMGHLVFRGFGDIICALGGTILQCLAPIIALIVFWKAPDMTGIPFALLWLASNLLNVSWYMADASSMSLQLVTVGGGEAYHDWNFIFGELGWLGRERFFSGILVFLGYVIMLGSLLLQAWMLIRIYLVNETLRLAQMKKEK